MFILKDSEDVILVKGQMQMLQVELEEMLLVQAKIMEFHVFVIGSHSGTHGKLGAVVCTRGAQ